MPELRKNKLTGELVAIAEERANRPSNFKGIGLDEDEGFCPFCRGNEHMTSGDVYKSSDERVRIIANKYPIVMEASVTGFGIHEVLIDTDEHNEQLKDFSVENIAQVFVALKIRMVELKKDKRIKYIQVFKNHGAAAGASQPHSHWQIVALPTIPLMQKNIYENSLHMYNEAGKCFMCDEIISSHKCAEFFENDEFKAYCNLASKFCYEIHITPKRHCPNFEMLDNGEMLGFAEIFKQCLYVLNKLYKDLSYNICILNSFVNMDSIESLEDCMHFYVQIIPRMGYLAGFEFSTSSFINSVPPEKAAEVLKQMISNDIQK